VGSFLDISLSIECPKCGSKSKKSLRWIKTHDEFTCHCGAIVSLKSESLQNKVASAEKGLAELQEQLRKFSKLNEEPGH
jgi:hypothetical protein